MPSITRLVVPLDGSPQANASLPLATGLAQALGVPVHLVRAVDTNGETEAALRQLAGVAHEISRNEVKVNLEVHKGTAVEALAKLLVPADLVVLGLAARPSLGTLPVWLLEQTDVPVLLRRAGGKRVMRVRAIWQDGSEAAVPWASLLLAALGAVQVASEDAADLLVEARSAAERVCDPANQLPVLAASAQAT